MGWRLAADLVVAIHLLFVAFVLAGGLIVARRRAFAWIHLPAAAWGAWIEFAGWVCPLTPLENGLRRLGGQAGYASDFAGRYLLPILYPAALTRATQIALGVLVLLVNAAAYLYVFRDQPPSRSGPARSA